MISSGFLITAPLLFLSMINSVAATLSSVQQQGWAKFKFMFTILEVSRASEVPRRNSDQYWAGSGGCSEFLAGLQVSRDPFFIFCPEGNQWWGVARQQRTLNEQGYCERFKVDGRLIQIQSAKSRAFHIPAMFLRCTGGRSDWHLTIFFFFYDGLQTATASGRLRDLYLH